MLALGTLLLFMLRGSFLCGVTAAAHDLIVAAARLPLPGGFCCWLLRLRLHRFFRLLYRALRRRPAGRIS